MSYEYELDIGLWRWRAPVSRVFGRYGSVYSMSGPYGIAIREQLVDSATWLHEDDGIPADLFAFSLGEPPVRHVTKVGGVPYRPSGLPWPTFEDDGQAKPLTFLAQFCFDGSNDLFSDLPGDVLLLFAREEWMEVEDPVVCEWQSHGKNELIDPKDVPPPSWSFVNCYGHILRTSEYPVQKRTLGRRDEGIAVTEATKIGGWPFFVQMTDHLDENPQDWPGRFLCQLGPICALPDKPDQWVNATEPVSDRSFDPERRLSLCDDGMIYLFLDRDGRTVRSLFMCS